jgi:hypothetical protein
MRPADATAKRRDERLTLRLSLRVGDKSQSARRLPLPHGTDKLSATRDPDA